MTYVLQMAVQTMPPLDESILRSLHFMLLRYDLTKNPGQWRPGAIRVEDEDGTVVYEAPDRDDVPDLMSETIHSINASDDHPIVRGAMAHLNLVLVHPFSDGNGRMARCVQSFVLASDGIVSPEFLSIEEYLGRNTAAYYAVLTDVAQGRWSPANAADPWVRFCITAHYRQALTVLRRIREMEAIWDRCDQLARTHGLPDRSVSALVDATRGWKLRRSLYRKLVQGATGELISDDTATRDLKALADAGLLEPVGIKRGRYYLPTKELRQVALDLRAQRPARTPDDPYELLPANAAPRLPGL